MSKKEIQTSLKKRYVNTMEWSIEDFFNLPCFRGDWIESPSFWVSHAEWCLHIYPFGCNGSKSEHISLYLNRKRSMDTHEVTFSLSIKMASKILRKPESSVRFRHSVGYTDFLPRSELSTLEDTALSDRTLLVICTIESLGKSSEKYQSTQTVDDYDYVETLKQHFEGMLISKEFSDILIKVKGREFNAHKSVIAARSSVFFSMLKHEMTESLSGIIDIQDCEPDIFESFLLFIYAGKLDKVTSTTAISLYKIADKYVVEDLKKQCLKLISTGLLIDNICDVLDLSATYAEMKLQQIATDFFIKHVEEILDSEKWLEFLCEKPSVANEVLKEMAKSKLNDESLT